MDNIGKASQNVSNFQIITDPLTGQKLEINAGKLNVDAETGKVSFASVLEKEEISKIDMKSFETKLTAMNPNDLRNTRTKITEEIKQAMQRGDRKALKEAQKKYDLCTRELRKKAGLFIASPPTSRFVSNSHSAPPPLPPETFSAVSPAPGVISPIPPPSQGEINIPTTPYNMFSQMPSTPNTTGYIMPQNITTNPNPATAIYSSDFIANQPSLPILNYTTNYNYSPGKLKLMELQLQSNIGVDMLGGEKDKENN